MNGFFEIPNELKKKVKKIDIKKLFNSLTNEEKEKLFNIFSLKLDILNKIENKILLLTQPLSEDGVMIENEKIGLYKDVQKKFKGNFVIKSHPREQTDYQKYFPDVFILPQNFPAELFLFIDAKLSEVVTIFSTAALNLKRNYKVSFLGTKDYPKLLERFGVIEDK